MGDVFRGRDTRLDRAVAIKTLKAEAASDPDPRARFEREARAISAATHPNICTLYDVGSAPGDEGSTEFLVMSASRLAADVRVSGWERTTQGTPYAVTPDGQRFLVSIAGDAAVPITLIANWTQLLK